MVKDFIRSFFLCFLDGYIYSLIFLVSLHQASYEMLMSCQKLSDEVEHHKQNHSRLRKGMELFRRNFVLRMEFDQVSALYAEASTKLANSQESLVTLQSQYDASIHELKEKLSIVGTELQEARAKLLNAKYLVESLKETEDYCQMEDDCLQYGARWQWASLMQNTLTSAIALFNPKLMLGETMKTEVSIAWVFLQTNLCQLPLTMTSYPRCP